MREMGADGTDERADPWSEQARRAAAHDARRRARRRRRLMWAVVPAILVGAGLAAWTLTRDGGEGAEPDGVPPSSGGSEVSASLPVPVTEPQADAVIPSSVAPTASAVPISAVTPVEEGVVIDDVWLLDQRDGTYDWGLVITSTDDRARGPIDVEARLVTAGGGEIEARARIERLEPGGRGAVGGAVSAADLVRVDADVAVELAEGESLPTVEIVAVEVRAEPGDGDGRLLTGRLVASQQAGPGRVVALWRGESGEVEAAVFHEVERVRGGIDARFEVPIDDAVPDRPPDDVLWST